MEGKFCLFVARQQITLFPYVAGVADGVGGWRAWGIDPGEFSHSLMRVSERMVRSGRYSPSQPALIIARAYYELLENKTHILGQYQALVYFSFSDICQSSQ